MRKLHIIANPNAGTRNSLSHLRAAVGPDCLVEVTRHPGHAEDLARAAAERGAPLVVAAGGDGTVNEVARGLFGSTCALGVIPLGSGNGFARHLGVPMGIRRALSLARTGGVRSIDVGFVNDRLFVCTAGLGFDGHISRHFAQSSKRGLITYVRTALSRYLMYQPNQIEIQTEGMSDHCRSYLLTFANASQYGNGAVIAPHANCEDGLLDICMVDHLPPWRAITVVWKLMRGTLDEAGPVSYRTCRDVRVKSDQPIEYHIDGEYGGESSTFEVRLVPSALKVICEAPEEATL